MLNYYHISNIINDKDCSYVDQINLHDYEFIVGPHFIDCHWYAVIIDIPNRQFHLLDPYGIKDELLEYHFNQWVQFYNRRIDKRVDKWYKMKINHPIQADNYNCAIFVMNFIYFYVNTRRIDSDASNMMNWRTLVADAIKNYSS